MSAYAEPFRQEEGLVHCRYERLQANRRFEQARHELRAIIEDFVTTSKGHTAKDTLVARMLSARDSEGRPMDIGQVQDEAITILSAGIEPLREIPRASLAPDQLVMTTDSALT